MSELKDYDIMDIEAMDDELLEKSESGRIQVTRVYIKSEADKVIAKLKADNKRLWDFHDELVKDCKWLPTTITPDKSGFETMVQCTNGKKRVASFRMFDFRWYDVNNGNKLNVVKWLWQPRMPNDEKKYNDELRHQKHKRCLAMARWCAAECVVNQDTYKRYLTPKSEFRIGHLRKWYKRWLAVAEQFKEVAG